MNTDMTM